ncbi:enoyl-CoA hydratase/isomerase family protein [Candidatus Protofrankia californiensis]|uniref:enoyl-CoA hydratase/isomerase family protein n=1 Tax=Candidatus Protofrankia californiensis TaxID=1839754 RepID=UPI0010414FD5|nr:enoyl-CoA hydratase-related protein [Candidatus Protofrankia californiensis]
MGYETLELTVDGGVASVVLNRPDDGNSFSAVFCREFGHLGNELASRRDVRVVLLRSRGRFFSIGGDIGMFSRDLDAASAAVRDGTSGLHMGLARLLRMDAPIVACVQGTAMGGAVSIIANCDLVYSARSARFGAAYARIGFTCDLGATSGLASRMGIARARRFLLLGEVLDADEAKRTGLVDHVLDDDAVAEEAYKATVELGQGPTRAYGEIRRLLARALANPLEAQLEDEAQALARAAATSDAREGITAFVEKRTPRFHGQ